MSTEKKIDRDASIQKLTAEYNALKMELEDIKSCYSQLFSGTPENKVLSVSTHSTQSNPGQMMHISDLKREMHQVYKDLRWAYAMKDIEEEEKRKQTQTSKTQ
jgi:hypothetical protein